MSGIHRDCRQFVLGGISHGSISQFDFLRRKSRCFCSAGLGRNSSGKEVPA